MIIYGIFFFCPCIVYTTTLVLTVSSATGTPSVAIFLDPSTVSLNCVTGRRFRRVTVSPVVRGSPISEGLRKRRLAIARQPRRRRYSGCVVLWCLGQFAQRPEAGPRMTSRGSCKSWTRSADGELCCGRASWVFSEWFFLWKLSVTCETVAWQLRFFEAQVPLKILTNFEEYINRYVYLNSS